MPRFKHVIKVKRKKGFFFGITHYELYNPPRKAERVYMILMNGRRKLSAAVTAEEIRQGIEEGTWEVIED